MPLNTRKNFHRFSSLREEGREREEKKEWKRCAKRVKCNIPFSLFLSLFFFFGFCCFVANILVKVVVECTYIWRMMIFEELERGKNMDGWMDD